MIVFFAEYPNSRNSKEGMMQRVAAIDSLVVGRRRVYFNLSYRRYFFSRKTCVVSDDGMVTQVNANFFSSFFYVLIHLIRANAIYVHSVYHAIRYLPIFLFGRVVWDVHGAVPEEIIYERSNKFLSWLYSIVECISYKRAGLIVCVTRRMADNLSKKYGGTSSRVVVFPIISASIKKIFDDPSGLDLSDKIDQVIYAGGTQRWQNFDMMVNVAKARSGFSYLFLVPDPQDWSRDASLHVGFSTAPPDQVKRFLKRARFGFLLRDAGIVNEVACPTKIMEYFAFGVVPIVLQPSVGDFESMGYGYILLSDFMVKSVPTSVLEELAQRNFCVLKKCLVQAHSSEVELSTFLS